MGLPTRFVRLSWWLIAASTAVLSQSSSPQVQFSGQLDETSVGPGGSASALFAVSLPSGFHVNSNTPSDEFLRPTQLSLDTPDGITVESIDYPEPHELKTSFSKEPLSVYEEQFVIGARLKAGQQLAPGEYRIEATLKYQVCSDKVCYRPTTRKTVAILTVVGPDG